MTRHLRPLDFEDPSEVNIAASFSALTILETLPQARRDPTLVPRSSVEEMAQMYTGGRDNPDHWYRVVEFEGEVVGHAIALMRRDEQGTPHGYSYTRYILPEFRRRGLAGALLDAAIAWWRERGAAYVLANTHPTNRGLRALFGSRGFHEEGLSEGRWPSVVLRLELQDR